MTPNLATLITRRTKLWADYVRLSEVAQETMNLDDGIAAGRAWKAFMDDFLEPSQRTDMDAIKFPNRRSG